MKSITLDRMLAVGGFVTGTISLIIHIIGTLRDKAKIKINIRKDAKILGHSSSYNNKKEYFIVTVINKGRRPIHIDQAKLRIIDDKPFLLLPGSLTDQERILTEKRPKTEFVTIQNGIDFSKAWYIVINDGTGKKYKKYLHRFPTFWRMWYWVKMRK